ncbi:transglycosylase SLT domain-containing protein [Candidatus Methylospira mobilis]|uniref:transglycosylase SLT domain-containing protein n=1 Tax=Candidatus Methylospira mobilis TaxID=1808979 RepID=UPI0028E784E5|nr:transglycosylase SLT domain-containing protein [Candidatus Methylospira mobilis]WNV03594.1 transglycosylase SLT domain-containing protein [Candidatus Methylospira mobilis]
MDIRYREKSFHSALSLACCLSLLAISLVACSSTKKTEQKTPFVVHLPSDAQAASTAGVANSRAGKPRRTGAGTIPANPADYDNLWDRLIDQYNLPEIQHREIDKEVSWFVNHPSYIDRVQKRAEPFLYSIVRQIEKYDVPGEIALLPVIESAFQPHVVSPASAAGIWQFIPSTGRNFGLKRSRSYDGRRDVYASTRAAIKYLKKLQNDFQGDWLLAVAAYNCGEGNVGKAVQRNQARGLATDFWSLDLPQETRTYVPRLLAVSRIFADPARYGVDIRPIPNKAMYKTVKVTSPLDLALAAQAADLTLDQMLDLNPGFKHPVADVDGTYRLFVPAHKYKSFKEQLPQMVDSRASVFGGKDYGQLLNDGGVQLSSDAPDDAAAEALSTEFAPSSPAAEDYHYQPPERARRHYESSGGEVSVHETIRSNAANDEQQSAYTTRRGDTLASIARQYGVSEAQIKTWNHMSGRSTLRAGTRLVLLGHQHHAKNVAYSSGDESNNSAHQSRGGHASSHGKSSHSSKSSHYRTSATGHTDAQASKPSSAKSGSKSSGSSPAPAGKKGSSSSKPGKKTK